MDILLYLLLRKRGGGSRSHHAVLGVIDPLTIKLISPMTLKALAEYGDSESGGAVTTGNALIKLTLTGHVETK